MDPKTQQAALAALKMLTPLLEQWTLGELQSFLEGRVDNIAMSQEKRGWSPTNQGDLKNDWPGDILAKQCDDALFVLAQQLPGKLSDGFRDGISPVVTPHVRAQIDETTTATEIAQKVTGRVYELAESVLQAVTP